MPAGVRVQQLTPVGRQTSNQSATIVRLMSPITSGMRPGGTGQQQFIQLNTTNRQQQTPLVIKAITTPAGNRPQQQHQPILLTANTQQKTILPQAQPQQVLLINQNTFNNNHNNNQAAQPKLTLQVTSADKTPAATTEGNQQEPTASNILPQLDGTVDDPVRTCSRVNKNHSLFFSRR